MKPFIILLSLLGAVAQPLAAAPPNIVIIFIDDMGYGDIGPTAPPRRKPPISTAWPARA